MALVLCPLFADCQNELSALFKSPSVEIKGFVEEEIKICDKKKEELLKKQCSHMKLTYDLIQKFNN